MKSCVLSAACLFAFALSVSADVTYYVAPGGDGSDPTSGDPATAYAHPQQAVDAADGTTPTTVRLAKGSYGLQSPALSKTQVLNVNKGNLTFEPLAGYGTVILAGNTGSVANDTHTRRVLTVSAGLSGVVFRDLIFK